MESVSTIRQRNQDDLEFGNDFIYAMRHRLLQPSYDGLDFDGPPVGITKNYNIPPADGSS